MHFNIFVYVFLTIIFAEVTFQALQGPPEVLKKTNTDEENDELSLNDESTDDLSPLKVVPAPDLVKERERRKGDKNVYPEISEAVDLFMLDQAKVIQKMVQEFDLFNSQVEEGDTDLPNDVDEIPKPSELVLEEPELMGDELEGKQLYEKALSMLNLTHPNKEEAFNLLEEASKLGNGNASALIAWAKLFGTPLEQDLDAARFTFEKLANVGHPEGHTGLGFLYAAGLTVNVSQAKALVHYTFGAIGGNNWAQMALAYRYWSGLTVASSCERALDFYRKVADRVSESVTFGGGPVIQRTRLLDEAENGYASGILDNDLIEYYQLLAEKGDIQAQVGLGQLHYQGGRGVDLDYGKALHYFQQAANSGNAIAMAYLGKIYLDGSDDIEANNEAAFKYFKKAADLNNPVGQSGLGLLYLYGKGVEKDYAKAQKYFLLAAEQGWVDGQLQLGNMYFNGLGIRKDYKLAKKYFSLASQSGHVLGYYNLAQMQAQGTGMLRSCPTAVELFKNVAERGRWGEILMQAHADYGDGRTNEAFVQYALLAELGYEVAQSNTAFVLDRNDVPMFGQEEALQRALLYWGRAAAQGYSAAQVKMGDYHYYGMGTAVDYEAAASHYRLAMDQQHNAQAMFNLGYMHEQGLGMARDVHLAKRCYDLAAETSVEAKVPVALALFKLNLVFSFNSLSEGSLMEQVDFDELFGANWDLYLITTLTAVLAGIVYFRRPQQ